MFLRLQEPVWTAFIYELFTGTFVVTYEKKKEGSTKLQKQALRKKNDTVNAHKRI